MTHVPETGAGKKRSRFMAPVSGACVMGVTKLQTASSSPSWSWVYTIVVGVGNFLTDC